MFTAVVRVNIDDKLHRSDISGQPDRSCGNNANDESKETEIHDECCCEQ